MPRLRIPRIPMLDRYKADGTEKQEHERLVLVAEVAGFVVVTSVIAVFVLMVASSGGTPAAAPNPAVPTITDAGSPASEVTPQPPAPESPSVTKSVAPPAVGKQEEVIKPKPKPKPAKPTSTTSQLPPPQPPQPPDSGGLQFGLPFQDCAPEGAHGITPQHHYPLECRGGHWQFDGDGHDHGHGHGPHH
jgi:hypothetical protein